ncbi:MAG TPA: DUF2279 domain-containing protein [Bacteroidia bacterium]|nr:DUF2279 domain-containing protein [Bacteroidia bacterium]
MRYSKIIFLLLIFSTLFYKKSNAQQNFFDPSPTFNKQRFTGVMITEGIIYTATMIGLSRIWYKKYPHSPFHFFNDDGEWQQMDKMGHFTTSYTVGRLGMEALRWSGVGNQQSIWYGGSLGLLFLATVEVADGMSKEWGFSLGDMTANTLGASLLIGQQLAWNEQKISMQFSYHATIYSNYRPDELGSNLWEHLVKDYNGQTYWLSANIASFVKTGTNFPKWLNVDFGYGAEGMIGGMKNPDMKDSLGNPIVFKRYRKFFLAPGVDLTRLLNVSPVLHGVFETTEFIKIPAPTLEFTQNKFYFKPLYF